MNNPKKKAEDLFGSFYMILFDSESDKGEEILVSSLAQKCALLAVDKILSTLTRYSRRKEKWLWEEVRNELNQI